MSYKALLFCSEASGARVIKQVLSELDFECEPCDEPFAAVKMLTSERLDATVIDCSNEQDAALLVKSARNSSFNQQTLFVAVVDGKSGVASAFRLGANLVLTKPVSVEQAKSTMRMARGLLHKNEVAKAAAAAAQATGPLEPAAASVAEPAVPKPPATPSTPWVPSAVVAAPPASILEVETEPAPALEPAEASVLESIPEPTTAKAPSAWPAVAAQKESPLEEAPEPPGPMASSLLEAEEAVSESETKAMAADSAFPPSPTPDLPARPLSTHSADASSGGGQGTAVARARTPVPQASGTAAKVKATPSQASVPATISKLAEPEPESNTMKWLAMVLLVLALAALGYMGWTKLHPSSGAPVPKPTNPAPSTPATPSSPTASEASPAQVVGAGASQPGPKSSKGQSLTAATTEKQTVSTSKSATNDAVSVPPGRTPAPQEVLLVSSRPAAPSSPATPPAEPVPDAPAAVNAAYGSENQAISSLVSTSSTNVPTPTLVNTRISQGVAQGLLIKKVQPVYPAQAASMHIQGAVELLATISKDGNVTNLKQLSGDAMLGRAAMDAVKQWKYRPYLLNGQPLEVQTQITVNFKAP